MNQDAIQQAVHSAIPAVTTYGMKILGALAILIIGRIVAGIAAGLTRRGLEAGKVEPSLRGFVVSLVRIGVLVFAVLAALSKFGVETASFVAVLGAAGFAVGFALQGSLANFAAGVMMLIFKPIKVGDLVSAAGHLGVIDDIGLFVTTMNTPDNQRVIIPNAKLTGDVINNVNGNGLRRVDLTASISYADDMNRAKKLCLGILATHPHVLKDPAPTVAISQLGNSSVDLVVRPWVHPDHYWDVWFDVTQSIKETFDAEGITIPFPQRRVWMQPTQPQV